MQIDQSYQSIDDFELKTECDSEQPEKTPPVSKASQAVRTSEERSHPHQREPHRKAGGLGQPALGDPHLQSQDLQDDSLLPRVLLLLLEERLHLEEPAPARDDRLCAKDP